MPAGLRDAVLRGLLPDPAQRWPSMEALLEHLRPPRRSRWPWAAGLAVVGAGALALALGLPASSPPSTCEREAQAVHEVWNEDAGARLREAFGAAGVSYAEDAAPRVRTRLDAYASALAEARRQACEAAVDRPDPRAACLDERLAELRGLVSVLEQAEPAAVRNAVAATSELGTVESCEQASSSSVAPPPAELVPEVRRVREELGRIRARLAAGSYESALELADQALSRAEALGYEPLLAEAQYLRGRALEGSGEYAAAEALLLEAQLRAEAAGHDELSATVAVRLVFVMSQLGRNEDAERWARHARAAVGRLPPGHPAGLQLESTLGALRWSQGRLEEAREHYERALEARAAELGDEHPSTLILRAHLATLCHEMGDQARAHDLMRSALDDQLEVLGPSHPEVSAAYGNLGVIELAQGELEASVAHTRTALEGLRSTVGELHPHYPRLLTNLAEAELALGQLEEARQHQQRALELFEQTLGPRSVEVGHANINLGAIHHEQGRFAEARAAYRRGLEIWQEHLRPDHPELAIAIVDIALADLELGHPEEAIAGFDRALALLGAARGDEHPSLAASLVGRGRAWLERGQPQRARADLERALRLREAEDGDPTRRGEARFRLGQAQWATGEHQAAMLSVEQARSEIAPRAGPRLREELDAWLAEHGPLAATSE
ncbi:MAG: tetratricopeptide repeat protein [Myxococcales bacterium]|nr:tetratricopeptide repeat protein [Myxococcales bacterium]